VYRFAFLVGLVGGLAYLMRKRPLRWVNAAACLLSRHAADNYSELFLFTITAAQVPRHAVSKVSTFLSYALREHIGTEHGLAFPALIFP